METVDIFKKFEPLKDNIIGILHELQNANPENYLNQEDIKKTAEFWNVFLKVW